MDKRKLTANAAVPVVLAIGTLGFTSQQGSAQQSETTQSRMA